MALSVVAIVILTSVVVYSADAAGIPKKAISTVSRFIESDLPTTTLFTDVVSTITSIKQFTTTSAVFENPAKTFGTTVAGGAVTANQTLNLPLITGTDTLGALGMTQTWTGVNTFTGNNDFGPTGGTAKFDNAGIIIRNPAHTFATTITNTAVAANRTLNLPLITQTETIAVNPQTNFTKGQLGGNATFTTSTTKVMLGNYATITPKVTGNIRVMVTGQITNSATTGGCIYEIRTATSNMGANGATLAGSIVGTQVKTGPMNVISANMTLTKIVSITGSVNTKQFVDLAFARTTAGSCTIRNIDWLLQEY